MSKASLHDLGIDRLSLDDRLQLAEAIWESVIRDVGGAPLPDWQRAALERRLADSVANPDAVRPWGDIEVEARDRAEVVEARLRHGGLLRARGTRRAIPAVRAESFTQQSFREEAPPPAPSHERRQPPPPCEKRRRED